MKKMILIVATIALIAGISSVSHAKAKSPDVLIKGPTTITISTQVCPWC